MYDRPPTSAMPAVVRNTARARMNRRRQSNETDSGVRHNVTFQRLYKDGDDWKTTESFGRDEPPVVAKVADMAHTCIYQEGKHGNGRADSSSSDDSRPTPVSHEALRTAGPRIT